MADVLARCAPLALTLFLIGCSSSGGESAGASSDPRFDPIRALAEGPVVIAVSDDGRVTELAGDFEKRSGLDEPSSEGVGLLQDIEEFLGFPVIGTLTRPQAIAMPGGTVVVWETQFQDVPIFDAQVRVFVPPGKGVAAFSATVPHDLGTLALSTTPDVSSDDAIDAASGFLALDQTPLVEGAPELGVFNAGLLTGEAPASVLAWRIDLAGEHVLDDARCYVDAHSGAVAFCLELANSGIDREVYSARNGSNRRSIETGARDLWYTESGAVGGAVPSDDAAAAYLYVQRVYDYYDAVFGHESWDGDCIYSQTAYVHYGPSDEGNAYFAQQAMWFADGFVTQDIVSHEYTHGVIRETSGLVYFGDSGALNEAFADIMAALLDVGDPGQWQIGEDLARGTLRDLKDPTLRGHPRHWSDRKAVVATGDCLPPAPSVERCPRGQRCHDGKCYRDSGFVHTNSSVVNHAAYLLTEGGTHADTRIAVRGIGDRKVEFLFFTAMKGLVSRTTKPPSFAVILVAMAQSFVRLNVPTPAGPLTAEDCGAVINAFHAVGLFYAGDKDEDCVDDTLDNCPDVKNTKQENADGDKLGDACDDAGPSPACLSAIDHLCSRIWTQSCSTSTMGNAVQRVRDNCDAITALGVPSKAEAYCSSTSFDPQGCVAAATR